MVNGTIQDNIFFGLPMNREKYKVIRGCCLEKYLEIMEFGDQTEIRERYQPQWWSKAAHTARKVYQDCDVYPLDEYQ